MPLVRDRNTLQPSARYHADTIDVGPSQRYDVIWKALKPESGSSTVTSDITRRTTMSRHEAVGGD